MRQLVPVIVIQTVVLGCGQAPPDKAIEPPPTATTPADATATGRRHGRTSPDAPVERDVDGLMVRLPQQEGGTMGYPYWDNTILYNEPAASLVASRGGAVAALATRLSDYTPCTTCKHQGRGRNSTYTVSDVVCYILVEIHSAEAIELVIDELKRRRAEGRRTTPIIWALRHHHIGRTYWQRLREKLASDSRPQP